MKMVKPQEKTAKKDLPEEEITTLEEVTMPEYTLIDVMREQKTVQNMLHELEQQLTIMVEAVKALGKEVIDSNTGTQSALTDLALKMGDLQTAFIKTVASAQPQSSHKVATKMPVQKSETSGIRRVSSQFDPADLMQHSWKGKKNGSGGYERGSLNYGWDFKDQFKPETIRELEIQGTIEIDQYAFSLNDSGALVTAKKRKR